jgi:hypothetical protein
MTQKLNETTRHDAACYTCDEYRRFTSDETEDLSHFIRAHHGHKIYIAVYRPVETVEPIVEE